MEVTLAPGAYTIGALVAAQVTIADDDVAVQVIRLNATDAVASEAGLDPGSVPGDSVGVNH